MSPVLHQVIPKPMLDPRTGCRQHLLREPRIANGLVGNGQRRRKLALDILQDTFPNGAVRPQRAAERLGVPVPGSLGEDEIDGDRGGFGEESTDPAGKGDRSVIWTGCSGGWE